MREDVPSETALVIALNRTLCAQDPVLRKILNVPDEPYSRWFVQAHSGSFRRWLPAISWEPIRRLIFALGEKRYPGGLLHILTRKRHVEQAARAFLSEAEGEPRQMVVIGAGLDPLALRLLPDFPKLTVYEIDHPSTQQVKRAALEKHEALDSRLSMLPVDLSRETAANKLTEAGFKRAIPTFFLAEGLLMYLSRGQMDSVFELVTRMAAPGSRFLFSQLDRAVLEDPTSTTAKVSRRLETIGEPLRNSQTRGEVEQYVKSRRLKLIELLDHKDLRRMYIEPLGIDRPIIAGEFLVLTEVAGAPQPTRARR